MEENKSAKGRTRLIVIAVIAALAVLVVIFATYEFLYHASYYQTQPSDNVSSNLITTANALMSGKITANQYDIFIPKSQNDGLMINNTDGKVMVYLASMTNCQFCARLSVGLVIALDQFGNFSSLIDSYSYGDGNLPEFLFGEKNVTVPVVYWLKNGTLTNESIQGKTNETTLKFMVGNTYRSKTVQFNSVEYYMPYGFYPPPAQQMLEAYPEFEPLYALGVKNGAIVNNAFGTPLESFAGVYMNGALTALAPMNISQNATELAQKAMYGEDDAYSVAMRIEADMIIAAICNANEKAGDICGYYNWTAFYDKFR